MLRNEARGKSFIVVSTCTEAAKKQYCKAEIHYDYCGSIAQALRTIDARSRTGMYRECFAQRVRVTKGRQDESKRWLLASGPVGVNFQEAIRNVRIIQ